MENIKEAVGLLFGADGELRTIIWVTLRMSLTSTFISSLIGVPLGVLIGSRDFKGKGLVMRITGTLMSLPPVVAGLVVFLLLSRSGPFGTLRLLYTVNAMVIAQVVLITPIITGMSVAVAEGRAASVRETCMGIRLSKSKQIYYLYYESRSQLLSVILSGFGRAVAEVGAVQLVGGNVQYKTRVMTTAIMLETNMGRFGFAVALGLVLLVIAFAVNSLARALAEKTVRKKSNAERGSLAA